MKALILSLLLISSCSKKSTLTKDAMGLRLTDVSMDITHLDSLDWLVGKKKEAVVSQSISFVVHMPKVTEEDLEHLTELKGIDSWVLRLIVQRGSERQDLGSLFARFKPKNILRGQIGGAPTNVSLKIVYAAAFASERFRNFSCPAFSHSKKIEEMKIQGTAEPFEISIGQVTPYKEKSHLVELTPSSFNAGHSLVGEYFLEIAPYDSEKKVIHGSFQRLNRYVQVISEKNEAVQSCFGEHPEITPR